MYSKSKLILKGRCPKCGAGWQDVLCDGQPDNKIIVDLKAEIEDLKEKLKTAHEKIVMDEKFKIQY